MRSLLLALVPALTLAAATALPVPPAAALEGGFDCAEGADGEIEPYVWDGEAWVPNPAYVAGS